MRQMRLISATAIQPFFGLLIWGAVIAGSVVPQSARAVGLTYLDADAVTAPNLTPGGAFDFSTTVINTDNKWGNRTFGAVNSLNISTIYESGVTEDSPEITQTVSGLTPSASYDMYVVFWNDFTEWRIQAGVVSGNLTTYSAYGSTPVLPIAQAGTLAALVPWDVPPVNNVATPLFFESNRIMYIGFAGTAVADGSGNASVFIDDTASGGGNGRTVLDGVAYVPAGTQVIFNSGDFNRSGGKVNADDYLILLNNMFSNVSTTPLQTTYVMGDINLDRLIDHFDLSEFAVEYDVQNGLGSFAAMSATVPEPAPALLVVLGIGLIGCYRLRSVNWHVCLKSRVTSAALTILCVSIIGIYSSNIARAAAVTGWAKDTSFGGGNTAALTNELTDSPTLGNGAADNANNVAIHATIPDTTILAGQQIVLTGSVDIIGGRTYTSAQNGFRFGLFNNNGSANTFGWLGYWVSNSAGGRNGNLSSRETDGTNFATVTFASTTSGRAKQLAVGGNDALVYDGTYTFNLTVGRFNDASTTAFATLTSPAGYNMEIYRATETDPTNFIFDFNRVGFLSASVLFSDQLQFHNVDVSVQSIVAPTMRVTAQGAVSIVNTTAAPIDLKYYEITSDGGQINTAGWASIDSTEGGDQVGVGWDVPANTTANLIAEHNLQGVRMLAPGASVALGNAAQAGANDLRFYYGLPGGELYRGHVEYVTAHPGDFDSDGDVDGADFVAWQTHFPTPNGATLADGDADGDGDVDGADFVVWQTNFPFTPGPGASPVPEPAAFCLAAASLIGLVCQRIRRRC